MAPVFPGIAGEIAELLRGCARVRKYARIKCRVRDAASTVSIVISHRIGGPSTSIPAWPMLGALVIDGAWLVLAFTKFFNAGETPDTALERLPERPGLACGKLDGAMVAVWRDPYTGELTGHTRGLLPWKPLQALTRSKQTPMLPAS